MKDLLETGEDTMHHPQTLYHTHLCCGKNPTYPANHTPNRHKGVVHQGMTSSREIRAQNDFLRCTMSVEPGIQSWQSQSKTGLTNAWFKRMGICMMARYEQRQRLWLPPLWKVFWTSLQIGPMFGYFNRPNPLRRELVVGNLVNVRTRWTLSCAIEWCKAALFSFLYGRCYGCCFCSAIPLSIWCFRANIWLKTLEVAYAGPWVRSIAKF